MISSHRRASLAALMASLAMPNDLSKIKTSSKVHTEPGEIRGTAPNPNRLTKAEKKAQKRARQRQRTQENAAV